jgi:hypothetical protein
MATITDLSITGHLKGRTFRDTLGGVDVYAGPNGAGKTTRILALLGAINGLAQTTTDRTRPYLGAIEEGAQAEVMTTGGSWRRDLSITNPNARAHKNATADAHRIVGEPIVSWDLSDWSGGTDGDRRKLLDRIARAGGAVEAWTYLDAQSRLEQRMEGVEGSQMLGRALVSTHPRAGDGGLWLQVAEGWANDAATTARAELRTAESILAAAKDERTNKPGEDLSDGLRAARANLARMQSAGEERAGHDGRIERAEQRLVEIKARGKALREQASPALRGTLAVPDARAALDAAKAEAAKPVPPPPTPSPVPQGLYDAAQAAAEADGAADDAFEAARIAHREVDDKLREAQAAERAHEAAEQAMAGLRAQAALPCRHCGEADPLGVLLDAAQADGPAADVGALWAAADVAGKRVGTTNAARGAAAAALTSANDALARAEGAARSAIEDGKRRADRIQADRADAVNRAEGVLAQVEREDAQATQRHADATARRDRNLQETRQEWKAASARLADLQAADVASLDPAKVARANNEADRLQALADAYRDWQRSERRAQEAAQAAADAETQRKATAALVEAVRAVRLEQAAACYGPVEDAARALLADAWEGAPQPYLAGPGDYGAIVNGERVQYEALSESERRITAAALVYALAVVSRQPCRLVLIDGLEVVQSDHRGPLLAALSRAHAAGLVDNVIVTCAITADEEAGALELADLQRAGVTIHRLG